MNPYALTQRWQCGVAATLVLFLAGCEDSQLPSGSAGVPADEAALAELVEAEWSVLSAPEDLQLRALDRLRAGQGGQAAAELLAAGLLAAEAGDLDAAGRSELASDMDERLELQWSRIAAAVLGADGVEGTLEGVERVLLRIDQRAPVPAGGERLSRARGGLERAQTAWLEGKADLALHESSRAADELRGFSAEKRARAYVAAALELLARARELAGPSPAPDTVVALARAKGHCDAAVVALEAGDLRQAVRNAGACSRIAKRVIAAFSAGVSDEYLADRVAEAVAHARELLARATEKVGSSPPPAIADALSRARDFLGQAEAALQAGEYREAIRAAHASAALSRRILAYERPGGPDLRGRAEAVVGSAAAPGPRQMFTLL